MPARAPLSSDHDLIQACQRGDSGAWEAIVRKYSRLVYSIALKCGVGSEEAEDVLQAVFLSLLRSIDRLERHDTLIPWLVTSARRQSWKAAQEADRRSRGSDEGLESIENPGSADEDLVLLERQIQVRQTLERIDERCRRLLEILFYEDPPPGYAEIARTMKMPVPSIGPTRLRCLDKLRRKLLDGKVL
jgi:RNA polymerase sigma factor (sigma-70 family)